LCKRTTMRFYDLTKPERVELTMKIERDILADLINDKDFHMKKYAGDSDTYIRKIIYLALAKIYRNDRTFKATVIRLLEKLYENKNEKIRQTVAYTLGEIGKSEADPILDLLEKALHDNHHAVRNGVIGALKQMTQKNPKPALKFAYRLIDNPDPKIRREIVHGIELHGRTYPEEVLPLLRQVQNDKSKIVRNMLIHVIGQISYKKDCLEKVVAELKGWENKDLVEAALVEIVAVHERYKNFSAKTTAEAKKYIKNQFNS
jgi:3-methyladenine DNA glycosylase AlkD